MKGDKRDTTYDDWLKTFRENQLIKCKSQEEKEKLETKFREQDQLKQFKVEEDQKGSKSFCSKCNSEIIIGTNLLTLCRKCKMKLHREIWYGSIENFKKVSSENYKKSCLKKYGVENPRQLKSVCKKATDTRLRNNEGKYRSEEELNKVKQTKLERYGDENFNNVEKIRITKKDRYGDENFNNVEKNKATKKDRYGNENFNNTELRVKNQRDKNNGNYFSEETLKNIKEKRAKKQKQITEKIKQTCLEKYGVENPMQNKDINRKAMQTRKITYPAWTDTHLRNLINSTIEKYGTFNHRKNYYYDEKYFDSSYELVYYIWLKDHNVNFEYHPKKRFEYFDIKGNKHFYLPDFLVEGEFLELKGPHLINDQKVLLDWKGNPCYEKTNCLKNNNVRILEGKDLEEAFKYVEMTYSKKYWEKFVCQKSKV